MYGIQLNLRDIIKAIVQFPDQPQKMRPALIISNNFVNQNSNRVIILPITSNPSPEPYKIEIQNANIENGFLPVRSFIIFDNIFTISQNSYVKTFGRITEDFFNFIMSELNNKVF